MERALAAKHATCRRHVAFPGIVIPPSEVMFSTIDIASMETRKWLPRFFSGSSDSGSSSFFGLKDGLVALERVMM